MMPIVDLLWRAAVGRRTQPAFSLAFSPRGDKLLSAGMTKLIAWGVRSGRKNGHLHNQVTLSVEFSPDGKLLAVSVHVTGSRGVRLCASRSLLMSMYISGPPRPKTASMILPSAPMAKYSLRQLIIRSSASGI